MKMKAKIGTQAKMGTPVKMKTCASEEEARMKTYR
jgi:hypothetical protein